MFDFSNFALDRISFWLGFIAASFFWLIASRLSKNFPAMRKLFREFLATAKERRLAGIAHSLRQETLTRAERNHLFANLCSLDDLIIVPQFIAPPDFSDPETPPIVDTFSTQLLGYLPDQPDFSAAMYAPRLSISDALSGGSNLVVVARPGRGKSTALAWMAAQIARKSVSAGFLAEYFPIYLNIHDFNLSPDQERSPFDRLIQAISQYAPVSSLPQIRSYIKNVLENHNAILLLDAVDELTEAEVSSASMLIKSLHAAYPQLRIVITANPGQQLNLTLDNFMPLALSGWNQAEVRDFIQRFTKIWNNSLGQSVDYLEAGQSEALHNALVLGWLGFDPEYLTPMEWSLRVWSALAGVSTSPFPADNIQAFVHEHLPDDRFINSATILACSLLRTNRSYIRYNEAEQAINALNFDFDTESANPSEKISTHKKTSSGAKTLALLEQEKFVSIWKDGQVSFSSPVWLGYFGGQQAKCLAMPPEIESINAGYGEYIRFTLFNGETQWVDEYLRTDSAPFYTHLLNSLTWMQSLPPNAPVRSSIMRQSAYHLTNQRAPKFIQKRILAATSVSNDPSLSVFFKQLVGSPAPESRVNGILGCGVLQDSRTVSDLIKALGDTHSDVRTAACFSLSRFDTAEASQAVDSALRFGDEQLRLAAAEILSTQPELNKERFEELLTSPDLLTRRSAVYGLSLIDEPWVIPLLEKTAIEDSQWVVRNASAQALENLQSPSQRAPQPLSDPADLDWLIAFAARLNMGISKTEKPNSILSTVLKSGSADEQIASMPYLVGYAEKQEIEQLTALLDSASPEVQRAAQYTLWALQVNGTEMPSYIAF